MYKDSLLLPQGKVEELYQNLRTLNSKIYVQRSVQLNKSGTRTRLLAWLMTDVELIALADPSIHSADSIVAVMADIDSDTSVIQ